jgi:ring-1,2-phenylacetyl-CoA epoxidase subunit PaaE
MTADSVAISFDIPENLQSHFSFKAGQFVNVEVVIDGKKEIRSYSICSSSLNHQSITIGVKEITNGKVSKYLNQVVQAGDSLLISDSEGQFVLDVEMNTQHYVFFAGGSGITPILSMMDYIIHKTDKPLTLVFSNQNDAQTMFLDTIQTMQQKSNGRLDVKLIRTKQGDARLDESKVKEIIKQISHYNESQFYVCGPNGIISAVEKSVESMGIRGERFKREYFTAKDASQMEAGAVSTGTSQPLVKGEKASIKMIYEGKQYDFQCGFGEKILDAAIDAGTDPPYSCMVAACCTCRAKVKNGTVEMLDKDALSKKDVDAGFVLTCQSVPRSKEIILDFDA